VPFGALKSNRRRPEGVEASPSGGRVKMPANASVYAPNPVFSTKTKVVPTTGLEPINRVFSPLPMIASLSVFISHTVTNIFNVCNSYLCYFGK
jgi:hypothetical protein